jgi:hypothetical protein
MPKLLVAPEHSDQLRAAIARHPHAVRIDPGLEVPPSAGVLLHKGVGKDAPDRSGHLESSGRGQAADRTAAVRAKGETMSRPDLTPITWRDLRQEPTASARSRGPLRRRRRRPSAGGER